MNVPKLRFKEFTDEWSQTCLSEVVTFSKGNLLSKSDLDEQGSFSCILYGELYTKYHEVIRKVFSKTNYNSDNIVKSKYGDILIPASGETPIDISTSSCLLLDNILVGGDINILSPKNCDGRFISYMISNNKRNTIARIAQGHSIVHLYSENLKQVNLDIPSLREQKKIADTLELLDKKIELQTKRIETLKLFKKGLLKKIFSSVNNYKAFKNIATLKNGYTFKNNLYSKSGKYNIVTISNVTGNKYIDTNFKNKYEILPTDLQPHQLLKNNDILVSMTGNVGRVSLNRGYNNLLNQRVGLIVPSDDIDPFYLFYVLSDTHFEKSMINLAQGAAQANISKEDIDNYLVPILSKEKQKQIAKILNIYFKSLFLEQEKLNKLKILKKGLMQNMFV